VYFLFKKHNTAVYVRYEYLFFFFLENTAAFNVLAMETQSCNVPGRSFGSGGLDLRNPRRRALNHRRVAPDHPAHLGCMRA
jgi:hypothetical protein